MLDEAEELDEKKEVKIYTLDDIEEIPDIESDTEIDEEADAFSSVAPPDAGTYPFLTGLGQNGLQVKKTKQGVAYHSVALEFTLQSDDPAIAGAVVRSTLSTNIGRGKSTSTLATFLNRNKIQVKGHVTGKQQLALLKKFIMSEQTTYLQVEWEAAYSDEKNKYIRVKTKQKDFSKDKDGKWIYKFEKKLANGNVQSYQARLYVVEYLGLTATKKVSIGTKISTQTSFNLGSQTIQDLEKEI